MTPHPHLYDVAIIGGGPAGSTAGNLLARLGHRVVVCEREAFPRFHVGESLLPECMPILERIGVVDDLCGDGFVIKRGATFVHEGGEHRSAITFSRSLDDLSPTTLQVERSRFDRVLLEAAVKAGANVEQPCRVAEVRSTDDGFELEVADRGPRRALRCRFLIDASGQSGFLAKRLGLREVDTELQKVALFAHFRGWRWPQEVPPGDIQVVSGSDLSWLWVIPLGEVTSVGLVMDRGVRRADRRRQGEILGEQLRNTAALAGQWEQAEQVGSARSAADFSYNSRRYVGGHWLIAGDAGSFVDPVFSTGVLLALRAGEEAAHTVHRALTAPGARARALARYQFLQRRRFRLYRRWVRAFYDPALRDLLCQPSSRFSVDRALTTVLGGADRPSLGVRWRALSLLGLARVHRRVALGDRLHCAPTSSPSGIESRFPGGIGGWSEVPDRLTGEGEHRR